MLSNSDRHNAYWHILHIGSLRPSYDCVVINSSVDRAQIKLTKAYQSLIQECHKVRLETIRKQVLYATRIKCTLPPDFDLTILSDLQSQAPGDYKLRTVEVAFDIHADGQWHAEQLLESVVGCVQKRNHHRKIVYGVCGIANDVPAIGHFSSPTYYYDLRSSAVGLKIYARKKKLQKGAFGDQAVVRLEWTLSANTAIKRHLGGCKIDDLLDADLTDFLAQNLICQEVDYEALGLLLDETSIRRCRNQKERSPRNVRYRAKQCAKLYLTQMAKLESGHLHAQIDGAEKDAQRCVDMFRQSDRHDPNLIASLGHLRAKVGELRRETRRFANHDLFHEIWLKSPSHIRGFLKKLRDEQSKPAPNWPMRRFTDRAKKITDHRIKKCFRPIKLRLRLSPRP